MNLECVDGSGGWWTHDDGNIELGMAREEVGMVVSQEDVFESSSSLFHVPFVGVDIEDRIDEDTLFFGLNIVRVDGEFSGFELWNFETLSTLLRDNGDGWVHI